MKITKARHEMLEQLRQEPGSYASYYPPMKWALEQGFASVRKGKFSDTYEITPAGLAALREKEDE